MTKQFKHIITVSFVLSVMLMFLLPSNVYGQLFGGDQMGAIEPDIETEAKYEDGLILFKFDVADDQHITDVKNGFFTITTAKNDFIEIRDVIYPKGQPYSDEVVFKGKFDVKVYIKSLKDLSQPVKLKFTVSYQICQEKPQEVCYPPEETTVDVTVDKVFKEVTIQKPAGEDADLEALKDLSSQSSAAYKPKGGNWLTILLVALGLLTLALFIGLSGWLDDDEMSGKFAKALVVLMLLAGAFLFYKALDIKYYPMKYSQKPQVTVDLQWLPSIEEGKEAAAKANKPVFIDTSAEWCVACRELEEYTFSDPEVAEILKEQYILVQLDFTKNNAENKATRKALNVIGMPTLILLDPQGNEVKRDSGFMEKDKFLSFLGVKGSESFVDRLTAKLKKELENPSILLFLLVFALGFLTSLTPCVYPVIPIVMGYIGTRSGKKKLKGFYLSIFFVLGLAIVYSVFGVVAAMSGSMMGASFQNPIVVIVIAAIFVIMGLSLAGLFEIPVPSSISSRVQSSSGKNEIIGSLIVGGVAGIIAAPCVGPVLIALLSWISQTKNVFLGFILTFVFSLGMGVIFLVVGTFSGVVSAMPKGGKWMDYIKYFFAAILIGGGVFILDNIIAAWVSLLLWGIFLVALSVFAGLFKSLEEYKLKNKLFKLVFTIIFLIGIFMFFKSMELKLFTASGTAQAAVEVTETTE